MALSLSEPLAIVSAGTSIANHDGALWGFWEGLVVVVLAGFMLQYTCCGHRPTRTSSSASTHALRKAQKLAKQELHLLQKASMDVTSVYLFPDTLSTNFVLDLWELLLHLIIRTLSGSLLLGTPTKPNTKDKEALQLNDCRIQLLHRIQAPASTNTRTKNHRIHVLGRALWFRFHVHANRFTRDALTELLESQQRDNFIATNNNEKVEYVTTELMFMKDTILWAVLPQDRPIIRHCLDELAWAMRDSIDDGDVPCKNLSGWPAEVLTLMMDCIVQTYDIGKQGEFQGQQQQSPNRSQLKGSELQSPADGGLDPDHHDNQAKRLCGYLHLLGVFMPCDDYHDSANSNDKEENDLLARPQLRSCFKLRPGILKEQRIPPTHLNGSDVWTKRFTSRLIENSGNETDMRSSFYFQNLPSLFLRLRCYSQCSHLLQYNKAFATARLQYLGLEKTVDAYVSEWEGLHHCMQEALLLAPEKKNPIASPIVEWLCKQTLSIAVEELALSSTSNEPTVNPQERIKVRQGLATTCYRLGIFATNLASTTHYSSADEEQRVYNIDAMELLHKGRHLQLLILEAVFRCGAKSIENLGTTLYVRETFRKQKQERGTTKTERSLDHHSLLLEPKKYFDLSQQLPDTITKLCRDHNEDNCTETALDELATSLCQALARTASELMPLPPRQSNIQPTGAANKDSASLGSSCWVDGMEFRIQQVLNFFHQAKDASQRFAKFQHAICTLPCTAAQMQAATDFSCALSQLEGSIIL